MWFTSIVMEIWNKHANHSIKASSWRFEVMTNS